MRLFGDKITKSNQKETFVGSISYHSNTPIWFVTDGFI